MLLRVVGTCPHVGLPAGASCDRISNCDSHLAPSLTHRLFRPQQIIQSVTGGPPPTKLTQIVMGGIAKVFAGEIVEEGKSTGMGCKGSLGGKQVPQSGAASRCALQCGVLIVAAIAAREVMQARGESGPLTPDHIRTALHNVRMKGLLPTTQYVPGRGSHREWYAPCSPHRPLASHDPAGTCPTRYTQGRLLQ